MEGVNFRYSESRYSAHTADNHVASGTSERDWVVRDVTELPVTFSDVTTQRTLLLTLFETRAAMLVSDVTPPGIYVR